MALTKSQAITHSCQLLRAGRSAALSTALATHDGWPYGSFITYATDQTGAPVFLFSDLSDHARNLQADNRASMLVEHTAQRKNPQTGPRVTLVGKIRKTSDPALAGRFFSRHPRAKMYAGFQDFNFYRMTIERAHYVGGFAKAVWFRGRELLIGPEPALAFAEAEADIIAHMNSDHKDAVDLYANGLLKRRGSNWQMVGIDCDGIDLAKDGRLARLPFAQRLSSVEEVRKTLVLLAKEARNLNK
ncbi:MAG: DUF2470 domain-containing protein [Rhodospirillales bacterium]|nr:DUF2470 domain-containing protein [Rhodospirillales bacterium]